METRRLMLALCLILLLDAAAGSILPQEKSSIVGGDDAEEGQWPWMAHLTVAKGTTYRCGGTHIANRWVLTAAHCFQPSFTVSKSYVRLGALRLADTSPNEAILLMKNVILHPNFTDFHKGNDVALVHLHTDTARFPFVRLASRRDQLDSRVVCWVMGWGKINENKPLGWPKTLQNVQVPIVPNDMCQQSYGELLPTMMCAGAAGRDSCEGDSGGPLMCNISNQWLQVGVVSYGKGCGEQKYPGVYTRVSSYTDFIHNNIGLYSAA